MDEQKLREFKWLYGLTRDQIKEMVNDTKFVYDVDYLTAEQLVFTSLDATGKPPAGVELNRSKQ